MIIRHISQMASLTVVLPTLNCDVAVTARVAGFMMGVGTCFSGVRGGCMPTSWCIMWGAICVTTSMKVNLQLMGLPAWT